MAKLGNCPISAKSIGIKGCTSGNPWKMPHKFVLGAPGFSFSTYDDFIDEDVVLQAIVDQNLFVLEIIEDTEDTTIEDTEYTSGAGNTFTTMDGKRGLTAYMNMALKQNELFQGYNNIGWTIFIIGIDGSWEGMTPDDTTVTGYTTARVEAKPAKRVWDTADISKTPIKITFEENSEMDEQGIHALPTDLDWKAKQLQPLTLVDITDALFDTDELTASFNIVNDRSAVRASTPLSTVEVSDIQVLDQAGAEIVPSDSTEQTTKGNYIFTATANLMTGGTMKLIPSITSLYYSEETVMAQA